VPTPAEIDRMGRSRDPDALDVAADACEDAADDKKASGLRWRAVLERVAGGTVLRLDAPVPVLSDVLAHGRPALWVGAGPWRGMDYRLTRGGWTQTATPGGFATGNRRWSRRRRCPPPPCAPAVLAALRAALAKVV
jgi:hypothetical protein